MEMEKLCLNFNLHLHIYKCSTLNSVHVLQKSAVLLTNTRPLSKALPSKMKLANMQKT